MVYTKWYSVPLFGSGEVQEGHAVAAVRATPAAVHAGPRETYTHTGIIMTRSSSTSDNMRTRGAKEGVRSSSRRSQSADGLAQPLGGDGLPAEQDAIVEEDKARGESLAVAVEPREPVVVAPRGRGRPRKVRPVVEVPIVPVAAVEASAVPVAAAVAVPAQLPVEMEPITQLPVEMEPIATAREAPREDICMDADVVESIEVRHVEGNVGAEDPGREREDSGIDNEVRDDAVDATQVECEEKTDEDIHHEEPREETIRDIIIETTNSAPAHNAAAQETINETPSAPVMTACSENEDTTSAQPESKEPNSSSSKRPLEQQQDSDAHAQQETFKKKAKKETTGPKISPATSQNLFEFTCRLLESQALEYEVRGRELEEKNALLAVKRAKCEKKIRRVKRQLCAYGHPVDMVHDETSSRPANGSNVNGSRAPDSRYRADPNWEVAATSTALTTTSSGFTATSANSGGTTSLITMHDAFSSRASFPAGVNGPGALDSLLPVNVQNLEAQIRDTLSARAQLVQGMMKDLQDMRGLNDKITRLR